MIACINYLCGNNRNNECHGRYGKCSTTHIPPNKASSSDSAVKQATPDVKEQFEQIWQKLMTKTEERPYDKQGKKDGNFNYIHQVYVADAMVKIRELMTKE